MAELTSKELSAISDQLSKEETMIKKASRLWAIPTRMW